MVTSVKKSSKSSKISTMSWTKLESSSSLQKTQDSRRNKESRISLHWLFSGTRSLWSIRAISRMRTRFFRGSPMKILLKSQGRLKKWMPRCWRIFLRRTIISLFSFVSIITFWELINIIFNIIFSNRQTRRLLNNFSEFKLNNSTFYVKFITYACDYYCN